ncbi:MAG TPA: tetratricopeptide repeat protein [Fimbriimonadales bacterium]|nr:tetratricopeptide repeat protein [Fimbriimonadales bacterium]
MNGVILLSSVVLQASVSGSIIWPSASPSEWEIALLTPGAEISQKMKDTSHFEFSDVKPGSYRIRIKKDKEEFFILNILIEEGKNEITLYYPPSLNKEERSAGLKNAFEAGQKALNEGRYDEAAGHFRNALAWDTGQAPLWASLALTSVGAKKFDDALNAWKMAMRLDPEEASYWNNYGSTLFQMGRYEEAPPYFVRAAELNPDGKGIFLSNAAAAWLAAGNENEAISAYEKAIEDPNVLPDAYYHLGSLLAKTGKSKEASEHLKKYLQLAPDGIYSNSAKKLLQQMGR